MTTLNHYLERFALAILLVGGVGLMMSMLLGVGDVFGTQVLERPLPGARELTESTMVLIVFGALAYAQIQRSHIRVELIYTRMGPRTQAVMDVITNLAALLFFGLLLWQAMNEVGISWEINEATVGLIRFPLWPARIILAVGTGLLVVRLVLDTITDLRRVATGEPLPQHDALVPGVPIAPLTGDTTKSDET